MFIPVPSKVPVSTKAAAGSGAHTPQIYQHTIPSHILSRGKVVRSVFCPSISRKPLCQLCWSHPYRRGTAGCLWHHRFFPALSHPEKTSPGRELSPRGMTPGPKMDRELHFSGTHGRGAARERNIDGDVINPHLLVDPFWFSLRKMRQSQNSKGTH